MKKSLIILFSFFLVGCQNYKELNNSAIVSAIGIDKKNNKFDISVQIVNTEKDNNDQENLNKSVVYTATGKNITDALNNINLKSPNLLYLGHVELVVISETLAKEGIKEISDYFLRSNDINKNFTILVAKKYSPEDILNVPTSLVNFPSGNILGNLEISSTIGGASNNIKFTKIVSDLKSDGKSPVISSIDILTKKNNEEKKLKISDLAIFKGDKLVGYLDSEKTKGFNFITDNIDNTVISFKCDNDKYTSVRVKDTKTKVTTKISNGVKIIVNITGNANIKESNCDITLNSIKRKLNETIEKLLYKTITKVKEDYKSDIFGFGNTIYLNNNSYWEKIKNNWNKKFQKLNVKIDSNIEIETKGNLIQKGWRLSER